jgi:hypothetical protein
MYENGNGTEVIPGAASHYADYVANGWSFDTNGDFEVKADFHYSDISVQDGWIGMTIEKNDSNYVSITAGSDSGGRYFYYEKVADGNTVFEQTTRDSNDGTLYISYNASADEMYLSSTGYGSINAWKTVSGLLQGQWSSEVYIALGGGSDSIVISSGEAYLDNFTVTAAMPIGLPPATDLNNDGFIDWDDVWIVCENWLGVGPDGDVNNDGFVDFEDYVELALAW